MKTENLMTRDIADGIASKAVARMAELSRKPQQREATVGAVDVKARTVDLSFSSEVEYERWWGIEILGHSAGEVRMGRLTNKAAALWNHNWDDQRGVVESARIDGDGFGRATIRFSKSEDGEQLLQDCADGIVTKVSVGYMVHGLKLIEERDRVDVYRVIDWEPFEISLVSVPADDTVGVGRALENPPEEPKKETAETSPSINESDEVRTITVEENETMTPEEIAAQAAQSRTAGAGEERTRAAELLAMGDQYVSSIPNARELAAGAVRDGMTRQAFQDTLLAAFNTRASAALSEQGRDNELGMDDKEVRRYSMMNAIRALANPNDAAAQKAAAFEIECGIEAQRALGRSAKGILVPPDVLARSFGGTRAMNTAQATAGAYLVENDVMQGSFIDLLRNRTTIMRLATVISGLVGNIDIPKKTSDGQAYWLGEGQDATETGFALGQISMSPKTIGAYTDITRRLMVQSSQNVEAMIRADLINAFAQEIDKKGWYGAGGTYEPRGIKNYSGINGKDFATDQAPTFAELVGMETEIAADNADLGSMAYVMHSRLRGWAKTTLKFSAAGSDTIWEQGNTINGYRTEVTNQLNASDMFFGNFADFIIGLWSGMDLTVDPYTLSKSGGIRIVAFQDLDMALRRSESICWGSSSVS